MAGKNSVRFREIGRRLAAVRLDHGLTQAELADRLQKPPSYVAKLELAERRLDLFDLCGLAQALGLAPSQLLIRLIPEEPASAAPST